MTAHGTKIKIPFTYVVYDPDRQLDADQQIITPGMDQYGGATITLATDGAGTEYVAFCAKKLSTGVFGFYIIDVTHGHEVTYTPFCTGRGSISNAGKWIAWKDKDYFKGAISGFVPHPGAKNYDADLAAIRQQLTEIETALGNISADSGALDPLDREALDRLKVWLGI